MKGMCMKDFLTKQFIAGNKTMTRRTGGLEAVNVDPDNWTHDPLFIDTARLDNFFYKNNEGTQLCLTLKPNYAKGSTVFIKEGYVPGYFDNGSTAYATDWNAVAAELMPRPKFKNKLFMPASEARYFVRIEDVYPQRLQDISEEDAIKEGVESSVDFPDCYKFYSPLKQFTSKSLNGGIPLCKTAVVSFATLIDSINGKGTWDKNPWVWVYKIKLVDKPENL